ncbi:MAG: hypothetical protein AB7O67_08910 [Vicinamibacterales bacterium]
MSQILKVAAVFALLATLAAPLAAAQAPKRSAAAAATHTITGVVKSVDATALVLTTSGTPAEMTFVLNSSTHRQGALTVGSHISVRYRDEGKSMIATAITASAAK